MKNFCIAIFLSLLLLFPYMVMAENFDVEDFFLDNGLQVVVVKNSKAPIVKQMLFYKVGAVDENKGKGGIAHLLEHLMFRGTKKVKGQEFNRILERNGADSNAFTAQDVTAYHQFMDISRLELAMFLEADRMQNLAINDSSFVTERDIVYQERKQRIDNNPSAKFFEKVRHALWQNHPYANPITGYDDEIVNLSKQDAINFYKQYYAPNNAVLVLAGDIDVATAKKMAEKYYGKLTPVFLPKKEFEKLPDNYKAKIEMELPNVKMGRFVKMVAVPSFVQDTKMAYALEVLGEYLSGDKNSPLYQKMIARDKVALSVSAYYDGLSRSYGMFVISVVPKVKLDSGFENIVNKGWNFALASLTEKELENVKRKMLIDLIYLKDNPESLAKTVGWMIATGLKLDDLQKYSENINNVSLKDIKSAADYLWNDAPSAVGILYPEGEHK